MSSNPLDPWNESPLPLDAEEADRYTVRHGGHGPVPGTPEAKLKGCPCPGALGKGWGFTVDNDCPLHGRVARRHDREQTLADLAVLEGYG